MFLTKSFFLLSFFLIPFAFAQSPTPVVGSRIYIGSQDATGATTTKPFHTASSDPSLISQPPNVCTAGDWLFVTPTGHVFNCTGTSNTWVAFNPDVSLADILAVTGTGNAAAFNFGFATSAYVDATNSANITYAAPFSGALTPYPTLNALEGAEHISLANFCGYAGAVPLNSSGCFAAAVAAATAKNAILYVPPALYPVDNTLVISSALTMDCDPGANFQKTADHYIFTPSASNIHINGCSLNGQFNESGYTTGGINTASSGTFNNWEFNHVNISDMGGVSMLLGGTSATVSGINIHGGIFTGTTHDNGGGIISIQAGISYLLMDGPWQINVTGAGGSTDGLQFYANVSSGVTPFYNLLIKDGTINYTGGKIPLEAGNYCANPCTFLGGPITIDGITINGQGYGNGYSFGNGIGYSTFMNSKVHSLGASGPSNCGEITQSSYNTIGPNNVIDCQIYIQAGVHNRIINNQLSSAYIAVAISDTGWPANTNANIVQGNHIKDTGSPGGPAIFLNNNTTNTGTYNIDHNLIKDNYITFTNSGCFSGSVFCQGIRIENDGGGSFTQGTMAYNQIEGNQIFGSQYPIALANCTGITHTSFFHNVYDTSNFNQVIQTMCTTNYDMVADVGNGSPSWTINNLVLKGSTSGTSQLSAAATAGSGFTLFFPTLTANDTICVLSLANCAASSSFASVNISGSTSVPTAPTLVAGTPTGSLTSGTTYYYKYYAAGLSGTSHLSTETSFVATSSLSINISFPPIVGALYYFVCRATTTGGESSCFSIPKNDYTDTGAMNTWGSGVGGALGNLITTQIAGSGVSLFDQYTASPTNAIDPLTNGLIHDFTFSVPLLSAGVVDSISGITHTIVHSAAIATGGKFGNYLSLIGNSGDAYTQSTGGFDMQGAALYHLSMSVWAKQTTAGVIAYRGRAFYSAIDWLFKTTSSTAFALELGLSGGNVTCTSSITVGTALNDGNWHLLAATYSQSSGLINLYQDGLNAGSCSETGYPVQINPNVGDIVYGFGNASLLNDSMIGGLSDFREWNITLTQDQITEVYNMGLNAANPFNGLQPGIVKTIYSTANSGSISTANLQCGGQICPAGGYELDYYIMNTLAIAAGTVNLTFGWTDDATAETQSLASALSLTATGFQSGSVFISTTGAANITYATATSGVTGTPAYNLRLVLKAVQRP